MEKGKRITYFYQLPVWIEARKLVLCVYNYTSKFPKEEKFGIIDQLRRATMSITANIAEGFGRFHYKEKAHYLYQARGSAIEVQNFIFLAQDLKYLPKNKARELFAQCNEIIKQINKLAKTTRIAHQEIICS